MTRRWLWLGGVPSAAFRPIFYEGACNLMATTRPGISSAVGTRGHRRNPIQSLLKFSECTLQGTHSIRPFHLVYATFTLKAFQLTSHPHPVSSSAVTTFSCLYHPLLCSRGPAVMEWTSQATYAAIPLSANVRDVLTDILYQ